MRADTCEKVFSELRVVLTVVRQGQRVHANRVFTKEERRKIEWMNEIYWMGEESTKENKNQRSREHDEYERVIFVVVPVNCFILGR